MRAAVLLYLVILPGYALAQHEHHMPEKKADSAAMPVMSHAFSLSLPMSRNGSGTSWLPDQTPMYMYMQHRGRWNLMFHGNLFIRYTSQNFNHTGKRGGEKVDAPSWVMGMAQRQAGKNGLLLVRVMLSADPLTMGGQGYPLLFQSGESWNGKPLVDRQHPHDLVSELAVGYSYRIGARADVFVYLAYPGEPALGPTAFMHRISSSNNPDAPLGHHWQDATHIDFGVGTLGFRYGICKAEGSLFTGREPDENRYDFDRPRFDSYSYRVTVSPSGQFSLQASHAFIREPERLHAGEDIRRTTASADYAARLGAMSHLTAALVWGMNKRERYREHAILAEANLQNGRNALYARYEWLLKSAEELELEPAFGESTLLDIQAFSVGYNRTLFTAWKTDVSAGLKATVYQADKRLDPFYGRYPLGAEVYLRLFPSLFNAHSM